MEVIRRFQESVVLTCRAFAARVRGAYEECTFRLELAFDVLRGRVPSERERHWSDRALEAPVLIDVTDWSTDRRIFSVLIWPDLENPETGGAGFVPRERVSEIKEVITTGAADRMWATRLDIDFSLRWDTERKVWVASDSFAYDGGGGNT